MNMQILEQERLVERVRDTLAPAFWRHLHALADHPLVGEVRGMGLGAGIQLTADKVGRAFFPEEIGVDARVTVGVMPPFVTSETELDEIFDALRYGLDQALAGLNRS